MSCEIPLCQLSSRDLKKIFTDLTIVPNEETGDQVYRKKKIMCPELPIEICMEKNDILYLPFRYAKKNFPDKIKNINYPEIDLNSIPFQISLRDDKIDTIAQISSEFERKGCTTVQKPPGMGKTILGAWQWHSSNLYGLTMLPLTALISQWVKVFSDSIPSIKDRIWYDGNECEDPAMIVVLCSSIHKVPRKYIERVGFLIIDEAHMFCTKLRTEALLNVSPKYILAETATLGRKDKTHNIIYAFVGGKSIKEISTRPYTVVQYLTKIQADPKSGAMGLNFGHLQQLLSESEERNMMWIKLLENNPHKKFLTLTYNTNHVRELSRLASLYNLEHDVYYGNRSGYNDSFCLIGTVSKMGVGFDEANNCSDFKGIKSDVLILMTSIAVDINIKELKPGMSLGQLYSDEELAGVGRWEQIKGRIRAENPIIIYFVDSHSIPQKHARKLVPWVYQTGGKVVKWKHSDELIL